MPELVTCVVAAAKKKGQLALGNIIGSNICNILLILGASSVAFRPHAGSPSGLSFGHNIRRSPASCCSRHSPLCHRLHGKGTETGQSGRPGLPRVYAA